MGCSAKPGLDSARGRGQRAEARELFRQCLSSWLRVPHATCSIGSLSDDHCDCLRLQTCGVLARLFVKRPALSRTGQWPCPHMAAAGLQVHLGNRGFADQDPDDPLNFLQLMNCDHGAAARGLVDLMDPLDCLDVVSDGGVQAQVFVLPSRRVVSLRCPCQAEQPTFNLWDSLEKEMHLETGEEQMTKEFWHSSWTEPLFNVLSVVDGSTLKTFDNVVVSYGGDCSGAEAPLWALQAFADTLRRKGTNVSIHHVFSSEAPNNQAAKTFLQLNCKPQHLFVDMVVPP
jgi:hypothetical protein